MPLGAQLVLMLLFAAAGVHHARHLERKYGRSAWGWPSWAWGVVTGLSLLIGVILLAVAERRLRREPAPVVPQQPRHSTVSGVVPAPVAVLVPTAPTAVPAGWQPDPSGRHQLRWWDGEAWTSSVHTNGVTSTEG